MREMQFSHFLFIYIVQIKIKPEWTELFVWFWEWLNNVSFKQIFVTYLCNKMWNVIYGMREMRF